ncbi:MAG: phospholipid carrier-dependent glycosyltransferase [Lentisphaeria bacterium]|nr:phospholipid carrier-dependent glycosyltransferase [Lentisphaeria bacterium]
MENEIRPGFSRRGFLLLLTLALVGRCLCMALMPIVDPSEARYAVMGRNMALSGNFMEPRFVHGGELQVFEGKPPLFFQSSGWCCRLFGVNEFSVRLPALVSGILILLCLYFCCRKLRDESTARLAVLICGATPVFYLFSGLCMTDLMLAASISIAVMGYMLFSAAEDAGGRRTGSLLFFASLGVGMMIKGPVAIVLAGLPVFLFVLINKRWKDLKHHSWICGTALFLLIALPWYWMMACRNPDFLEYFFFN